MHRAKRLYINLLPVDIAHHRIDESAKEKTKWARQQSAQATQLDKQKASKKTDAKMGKSEWRHSLKCRQISTDYEAHISSLP